MNPMRAAIILMLLVTFQGCAGGRKHMMVVKFPSHMVFRYDIYEVSDGKLSETILTQGEPLTDLIEKWCNDNMSGWSTSWDSFAPSFVYRTPDFSMNVRSDFIVANIKESRRALDSVEEINSDSSLGRTL